MTTTSSELIETTPPTAAISIAPHNDPPHDHQTAEGCVLTNAPGTDEDARGGGPPAVEESSELIGSVPSVGRSKWVKLRSTIKVACAFAPSTRRRQHLERQDSFLKRFSTRQREEATGGHPAEATRSKGGTEEEGDGDRTVPEKLVINPDESFMFAWLTGLTCTVLYNLWTCIAREAFPEIRAGFESLWFAADALCDLVYLLDVVVQLRTGYLERGLIVYDAGKLVRHYVWSRDFVLDAVSLIPLDLVQIYVGVHPLIRFPRFVKAYRLCRFVYMVETRTAYPNMWRVANLSHVLFLGCHWFAAFYFLISKAEQFRSAWGYPLPVGEYASVTQKYLRSLYWSTLTLTTIGDLQSPESNWEFAFTITSYLIGVFVFATIVGQVGNVITHQNASRQEFERHLDGAKSYMRYHNVPRAMQQRVQRWYDYAWSRGRINGGGDINSLGLLPDKLKTELAIHVNLETLKKVAIFHTCEPEFLHDLVLKMKAYIFTPRDLICRKGEVAREMFIIADGLVEVVSDSGEVLKQMVAGDFFGEIGILNLDGGVNRRTADVRSLGYSELFVLSRDDVLAAFKDHPEAEILIKEYGQRRLRELDEHKKRRLCERLAKELSTPKTERTAASTVGKMVLSTGLLHGIGIAASSSGSKNQSSERTAADGSVVIRSTDLPNGIPKTAVTGQGVGGGGDLWANLLKMTVKKADGVGSRDRATSGTDSPVSGVPSQERKLLPVLRRKGVRPETEKRNGAAAGSSSLSSNSSPRRRRPVVESSRDLSDATTRRLAGILTRKRGAQPRPERLWSLGTTTGKAPTSSVSRSIDPKSSTDATPSGGGGGGGGSGTPSTPPVDGGHVTDRARDQQQTVSVSTLRPRVPGPSSDGARSGVPSNRENASLNKSNAGEDSSTVQGFSAAAAAAADAVASAAGTTAFRLSEPQSTVQSEACPVRATKPPPAADVISKPPDFQSICSDLSDMIRNFVHGELMAVQTEYRSRLQRLEEDIAQKQSLIDRLSEELLESRNLTRTQQQQKHV